VTTPDRQGEGHLLSVITVHLDDFSGLDRTRESLERLRGPQVEWIVVDGGSTPGSEADRAYLEHARRDANVFIGGPDAGIYDAMNKGTARANGKYVLYLNAGDTLHPEFDPSGLGSLALDPRNTRSPAWLRLGMPVSHQAILFRRDALGPAPYREQLVYAGDYELLCRLHTGGARVHLTSWPVCVFDLSGASSANMRDALSEEADIRKRYFRVPAPLNLLLRWARHCNWRLGQLYPGLRRRWRSRV
jgi:putative colanic acid biosynthesis glycosyltransferase